MTELEREYRKAISSYPRGWRRHHGEALLGVLLDKAEAEGRTHMSQADRKDLAHHSRRLRVANAAVAVLFGVALVLLAHTAALALNGVPLQADIVVHAPTLNSTPIGGVTNNPYSVLMPAYELYLVSLAVALISAAGGILIMRNLRRRNRVR